MEYSNVSLIVFLVLISSRKDNLYTEKKQVYGKENRRFGTGKTTKNSKQKANQNYYDRSLNIDNGFQNERCPPKTVPIRRIKKEDLINARKLLQNRIPIDPSAYTLSLMDIRADNQKQTGCFNVLCSGFVQVDNDVSLGAVLEPLSVYGKDAWALHVKVYRDPQTGNWWLITTRTIGYWPKRNFTHLTNNASVLRYGGVAGAKPQTPSPPMGNGYLPQLEDYLETAFMRKMKYIDEKGQSVNLNPYGVPIKHDATLDCYNILFAGNIGGDWEITTAFGGPGGMCP
ncbi:uncharacterized protein LOC113329120 [Papaver somniferum]|uniref:uncharacterized protein LOC113329028 n=1 Tax=Papaver somniferum TaxID=3469 RepID=UPI000E6F6D52|nr:uncharacterized protein LOC113329028 [Papaver somniferum]XP_026431871.1 uncharacterized protein LOC113329120 [Papaver somniferum]